MIVSCYSIKAARTIAFGHSLAVVWKTVAQKMVQGPPQNRIRTNIATTITIHAITLTKNSRSPPGGT